MAFENHAEALRELATRLTKQYSALSEVEQLAFFERILTTYPEASRHGSIEFGLHLVGLMPEPQEVTCGAK